MLQAPALDDLAFILDVCQILLRIQIPCQLSVGNAMVEVALDFGLGLKPVNFGVWSPGLHGLLGFHFESCILGLEHRSLGQMAPNRCAAASIQQTQVVGLILGDLGGYHTTTQRKTKSHNNFI